MKNPFNFGNIASDKMFIDREKELKELRRRMASAEKVLLISPRRFGKTSLAFKLKEELAQDCIVVYFDTLSCSSLEEFLNNYSAALARTTETSLDKMVKMVKEFFPTLRPQVQISQEGEVTLRIVSEADKKDIAAIFETVMDLPEKVAIKRKKPVVIIFDEFQSIQDLGGNKGASLLWKIRSVIQHHHHVGYLFSGSQKHMLEQMAVPKDSPFYNMMSIMPLGKIPEELFVPFLARIFKESGIKCEEGLLQAAVRRADNVPFYLINICNELWDFGMDQHKPLDTQAMTRCILQIIQKRGPDYEAEWERITPAQKNVLRAVAAGERSILAMETIRKYSLGSPSTAQRALLSLTSSQYLMKEQGRYAFEDVWFKEWINGKLR